MAGDLKAGDRLRMVGGVVKIQAIEPDAAQPVYNLKSALTVTSSWGKKGCWSTTSASCNPLWWRLTANPNW
jgi:hypothetical protein